MLHQEFRSVCNVVNRLRFDRVIAEFFETPFTVSPALYVHTFHKVLPHQQYSIRNRPVSVIAFGKL